MKWVIRPTLPGLFLVRHLGYSGILILIPSYHLHNLVLIIKAIEQIEIKLSSIATDS